MRKHPKKDNPAVASEKKHRSLRQQLQKNRRPFIVYVILRTLVVISLVGAALRGNYENVFLCILTLVLFMIPAFMEVNFGIALPDTLQIIILCFIFAAEILGELRSFYVKVPGWDTMLHTVNGFLCAAIGFSLVDLFNRNKRFGVQLSPLFLAIVAFCFSMTIGILWEFFEFGADYFLHTDMQKDAIVHHISSVMLDPTQSNKAVEISGITQVLLNGEDLGLGGYLDIGLYDTMKDLFVNFIGAVIFSFIGFFYVRNRGNGKFASQFIPVVNELPGSEKAPGKQTEKVNKPHRH